MNPFGMCEMSRDDKQINFRLGMVGNVVDVKLVSGAPKVNFLIF